MQSHRLSGGGAALMEAFLQGEDARYAGGFFLGSDAACVDVSETEADGFGAFLGA